MKKCQNCSTNLADDYVFCPICGWNTKQKIEKISININNRTLKSVSFENNKKFIEALSFEAQKINYHTKIIISKIFTAISFVVCFLFALSTYLSYQSIGFYLIIPAVLSYIIFNISLIYSIVNIKMEQIDFRIKNLEFNNMKNDNEK